MTLVNFLSWFITESHSQWFQSTVIDNGQALLFVKD
jgi:hypothetical protein